SYVLLRLKRIHSHGNTSTSARRRPAVFPPPLPSARSRSRLAAMESTDDGFELAAADLSLRRGGGDPLGNRQHGASAGWKLGEHHARRRRHRGRPRRRPGPAGGSELWRSPTTSPWLARFAARASPTNPPSSAGSLRSGPFGAVATAPEPSVTAVARPTRHP
ncbi:MAG: hypothetical protein ACLTDR_05925, partial [Adlercreutzia equolifaciens]